MQDAFPTLSGGSGAAFLLDVAAATSLTLDDPVGRVVIRSGAPFATVSLTNAVPQEDAKNQAWQLLQEALDVFSASQRATLQTANGELSYLVWCSGADGYELVVVDTIDAPWSINMRMSGGEATASPPPPPPLPRHPALRFFRLALASSDLFDAFRNAYLALECLASDATQKGSSESELDWLKRALNGPLSAAVPSGLLLPGTVDDIYRRGRLPVFHAKTGSTFYAPHGPERQEMQERFDLLILLVTCLLQHRFGHAFVSRGATMSQDVYDSMTRSSLSFDEIVLLNEAVSVAVPASVTAISVPRRFNQMWGRTTIDRPKNIAWIDGFDFQKGGVSSTLLTLDERVPLQGVSTISIEINVMQYHSGAKKPVHRR